MSILIKATLAIFSVALSACSASYPDEDSPLHGKMVSTRRALAVCETKADGQKYFGWGEDIIEARNMTKKTCSQFHKECTNITCEERSGSLLTCGVAVQSLRTKKEFYGYGPDLRAAARSAHSTCSQNLDKKECLRITQKFCTRPNPISSL